MVQVGGGGGGVQVPYARRDTAKVFPSVRFCPQYFVGSGSTESKVNFTETVEVIVATVLHRVRRSFLVDAPLDVLLALYLFRGRQANSACVFFCG